MWTGSNSGNYMSIVSCVERIVNELQIISQGGDPPTWIIKYIKHRVFEWDNSMCDILWSLGDYWNEATNASQTQRVMWDLESNGIITEYNINNVLPNEPFFDNSDHPVAKKKKKSKKKRNSKKEWI
ncbi:hypothetical protein GLOIN_2v1883854 [Rhizophagus clarus]|uniref:Uncharacterized protein n=1 Tax=Rhizophagus clarus TaxID=94130 RepID=A0A8H3LC35_9GLOM|nr:hypothetical protein GLOIN_2v1883854 [Rhizophagus clarus]